MCVLTQMGTNDKAFVWFVQDFADGEPKMEKFACRLRTAEDAAEFQKKFKDAQTFNSLAKAEKEDELVWADPVEDIDEPVVDDIDTNKTAEEAADE